MTLIIGKRFEKRKKAYRIRDFVQSKTGWMSLADFGASYGRLEKKTSKRKPQVNTEDRWSYLREILGNSKTQTKKRFSRNR